MSVQTNSSQNGYIWENKEINLETTCICFVNKKFCNADSATFQLSDCIADIESKTQCSIVIHGQKSEVIWFCIKHNSIDKRQHAFDLINKVFNNKLNEVKLPKLILEEPREDISSFRLSTPSPPPPSILNQSNIETKSSKTTPNNIQIAAINSTRKDTTSLQTASNQTVKKSPVKSSMTRSSTESFISSLTYSKSSLTSNLRDEFTNRFNQHQQQKSSPNNNLDKKLDKLKIDNNTITNKYKLKNRYTVDFLLQRADTVNSKKQPSNWKELSEKYPTVCFNGKVISYFDPYKYHEHWEKTKKQNTDLHGNDLSTSSSLSSGASSLKYTVSLNAGNKKHLNSNGFGYNHTDDFLNLNTISSRDLNNNYYNFNKAQNRMTMIHPSEVKLKRFDSLHYNAYGNNNINNNGNDLYFMKKQQQQHDIRHVGYDGITRKQMSKTHSNYNFNNN